jgi:hypothetical protein
MKLNTRTYRDETSLVRRLHQGEMWVAQDGRALPLVDMDPDHRRNLLAWLRRNAKRLKWSEEMSLCLGPQPSGDAASDCFDAMLDRLAATPAAEWIEDLPLVARLRELVDADAPARRRRALAMPVPAGAIGRRT